MKDPGSLTLYAALEPNHDHRTLFAQLLGTEHFAAADSTGKIILKDVAQGRYSIRLSTTLKDYTPYFGGIAIQSGKSDIFKDTLRLVYTGIPVISHLQAVYDTASGKVTVSWEPARYEFLKDYMIYRGKASDLVPPLLPMAKTLDSIFVDSIFPEANMVEGGASSKYEYRVRIRHQSDDIGPVFGSVSVSVAPRALVRTSLRFSLTGSEDLKVGMGDSVVLQVHWKNPTRKNATLQWFSAEGAAGFKPHPYERQGRG